jgi:pimeloyl-ACP methyl ester carboxylesterase
MPVTDDGTAYDIRGEGENLLLINGIGAARESWALQIGDLAAKFRCVTFDNRGVGDSEISAGPYTTRQLADDAARLMRTLKIDRAHVMGVSMGGAIAQELAINHPELVDRLAIVCSWEACDNYLRRCFSVMREMALSEGPKGPEWVNSVQRFLSLIGFAREDFADSYKMITDLEEAVRAAVADGRGQRFEAFVAQADACLSHDTRGRVQAIKAPTLILAGDLDSFTPLPLSEALARDIPGATFEIMHGCGHVMFYERPTDFNARIVKFLNAKGA